MINYYTDLSKIPDRGKFILAIDIFFNAWVMENKLNDTDNNFLGIIDKSKIGPGINRIITPYGVGSYKNISTGCKALILLSHLRNAYTINIQECGQNVIDYIFYNMDNINLYSSAYKAIPSIEKPDIYMNGKKLVDFEHLEFNWR